MAVQHRIGSKNIRLEDVRHLKFTGAGGHEGKVVLYCKCDCDDPDCPRRDFAVFVTQQNAKDLRDACDIALRTMNKENN